MATTCSKMFVPPWPLVLQCWAEGPTDATQSKATVTEGWIALPTCSLDDLIDYSDLL